MPALAEGQEVVIDALAWSQSQLRAAVVVVEPGELRGQVAVVHVSDLVLELDEGGR